MSLANKFDLKEVFLQNVKDGQKSHLILKFGQIGASLILKFVQNFENSDRLSFRQIGEPHFQNTLCNKIGFLNGTWNLNKGVLDICRGN